MIDSISLNVMETVAVVDGSALKCSSNGSYFALIMLCSWMFVSIADSSFVTACLPPRPKLWYFGKFGTLFVVCYGVLGDRQRQ
jgi:hypothetical protein